MADQGTHTDTPNNGENVRDLFIVNEMKESYLNYAMTVIVSRALPDVRDGLKPVQRRILFAMKDLNLTPRKGHRKSAKIVGETMGNYHPHGDQAIYNTLVRMAQPWRSRYPLVNPQGNFGSIDGDNPAAMRYTEARMSEIATEMLEDIEKETVDFEPNFDETKEEPEVLPSRIPNLLCNGSSGIAVGMSTNIPPHNIGEVCDALLHIIDHPDASLDEIRHHMPAPDFPTGGKICGEQDVIKAYRTGRGNMTVRARVKEEFKDNRNAPDLVFTEIPFATSKRKLIEQIADGVKKDKIEGVRDVRDETDRDGIRIVVELKRGHTIELVKNQLFKFTQLQRTISMIFRALVDQEPQMLTLKEMLEHFIEHRKEIIRRRTEYLLAEAEDEKHRLEGLETAVDNLDRVIEIIRGSEEREIAGRKLQEEFDLSEKQSDAILRMQLGKLTGMEREKIRSELEDLRQKILEYENILENEDRILDIIREDLNEIRENHGDPRQTELVPPVDDMDKEDLVPEESYLLFLSDQGYTKLLSPDTFSRQHRGGVGIIAQRFKEDDYMSQVYTCSTHDYLLSFADSGQVYWRKGFRLPDRPSRDAQGRALINYLEKKHEERITQMIPLKQFPEDRYLTVATRQGLIKKTKLSRYSRPQRGGIRGIRLDEGDYVVGCAVTSGDDKLVLTTQNGNAIRIDESEVSATGRYTRGVIGIRLRDDDHVVNMVKEQPDTTLLTISEQGYGKRTTFSAYSEQKRGGYGLITLKTNERNGKLADSACVRDQDDLIISSKKGLAIRIPVDEIPKISRNTAGVKLMDTRDDDSVASISVPTPKVEEVRELQEDTPPESTPAVAESS